MTPRLTVVGSLNMDLVLRAPRIPQPGETVIGTDFHTMPGGKGANQAVAAARLGAHVSMVGRVGCDAYADGLLENLQRANVDHTYVLRDLEVATGVALIVVDDSGENSIVVASGANKRLDPADVDAADSAIAAADVLVLQLESPLDTVLRAAEIASQHAVRVVLNPAPAQPLLPGLLPLVDVLVPNENETALLTGMPIGDLPEFEAAAAALRAEGIETVIVTLGRRGALLTGEGQAQLIPAFNVDVVDTTAAGDAFVAGFSVALAEGGALPDAVRWGNAAGALAATRLGAQPSLPLREEVRALLDRSQARTPPS